MTTNKELHRLYNGDIAIMFYPDSHRYKREGRNGYEIGVTSVSGQLDKPGLIYWATGLMADYLNELAAKGIVIGPKEIEQAKDQHRQAKQKAASLGSAVHEWVEKWTHGENPVIPAEPYDDFTEEDIDKIVNGIMAFLKWVNEHNVKIVHAEKLIYSKKHEYVGTLDAIAEVDGKLCVIDYKTSKGIYTEMRYQTIAYKKAYEEEMNVKVDGGRWIIKLGKEDGDFQAVHLPASEDDADYKAFLGLLTVKKRAKALVEWEKQIKLNS